MTKSIRLTFISILLCFVITGCGSNSVNKGNSTVASSAESSSTKTLSSDASSEVTVSNGDSAGWETIPGEVSGSGREDIKDNISEVESSAGEAASGETAAEDDNRSASDSTEDFTEDSAGKDSASGGTTADEGTSGGYSTDEVGSVPADTEATAPDSDSTSDANDQGPDDGTLLSEGGGQLIVLDPGHTAHLSNETEPLGPGSTEMKAKDTLGTSGISSGMHEYELNLMVCQKLRDELLARGYQVILTHDTNDVTISCAERAQIASNNDADLFLRVHADGSTDSSAHGAMTICITSQNQFHPELYAQSKLLSQDLIDTYCEETGQRNRGVWETDFMTGNNWSEVPATLIEMGFMTNPEEDLWMASADGQKQIVSGIADGIDRYFSDQAQ